MSSQYLISTRWMSRQGLLRSLGRCCLGLVALLVVGGAAEVLPVSLNCPLPLRRTHPPTLVCCFCIFAAPSISININPITYQIPNNPTFEIAHHPAPSLQRRPQRKRRCEILNIPHNLPSLNLTPLRTTHIQQELWTYKKDKAFLMTPTEVINTLYYDDMDILHIDNWRFFTPKKRDRDDTPLGQKQYHTLLCPHDY